MFRFLMTSGFIILFLVLSIPLLLIEWIIGKFNPEWKDRSCQAIVQWAFRCCAFMAGARTDYIGMENIPKEGSFAVGFQVLENNISLSPVCKTAGTPLAII